MLKVDLSFLTLFKSTELGGVKRLRDEADSLKQPLEELSALRDSVLSSLKLGRQAPGYKTAQKALEQFIGKVTIPA